MISDGETSLPTSKAHRKISNTLHVHVVTIQVLHAIETLSLWAKIQRNLLCGCSDTVSLCSRGAGVWQPTEHTEGKGIHVLVFDWDFI